MDFSKNRTQALEALKKGDCDEAFEQLFQIFDAKTDVRTRDCLLMNLCGDQLTLKYAGQEPTLAVAAYDAVIDCAGFIKPCADPDQPLVPGMISNRIMNNFVKPRGIKTVGQLAAFRLKDLMSCRSIGKGSWDELRKFFRDEGYEPAYSYSSDSDDPMAVATQERGNVQLSVQYAREARHLAAEAFQMIRLAKGLGKAVKQQSLPMLYMQLKAMLIEQGVNTFHPKV